MINGHAGTYKVCVVTSVPAAREPRAPKHVAAVLAAIPEAEVCFIDMAGVGQYLPDPPDLLGHSRLRRITLRVPTLKGAPLGWAYRNVRLKISSWIYSVTHWATPEVLGTQAVGLGRVLSRIKADLYIAHNVETLMPAAIAAKANRAKLIFDCMEFYSDMGDSQSAMVAAATAHIEKTNLPCCHLVLATSECLAEALADVYRIAKPLVLLNAPPITKALPEKQVFSGLRLYWRNSVIGFGQRGLDDALIALTLLPNDICLFLQGRLPLDGGHALRSRIAELGLSRRVTILPPYALGQAIAEAALYDIGLCMERRGPANHEYTVSNKLFDYMMAGLAVVVPDLEGLTRTVKYAASGLTYLSGSPESLAEQIHSLYSNPDLLKRFASASRAYALEEGNAEYEMSKFKQALTACVENAGHLTC